MARLLRHPEQGSGPRPHPPPPERGYFIQYSESPPVIRGGCWRERECRIPTQAWRQERERGRLDASPGTSEPFPLPTRSAPPPDRSSLPREEPLPTLRSPRRLF